MACKSDNPFLLLSKRPDSDEIAKDLAYLTLAAGFPSDVLAMARVLSEKHAKHMLLLLEKRSFLGEVRPAAREYVRHIL